MRQQTCLHAAQAPLQLFTLLINAGQGILQRAGTTFDDATTLGVRLQLRIQSPHQAIFTRQERAQRIKIVVQRIIQLVTVDRQGAVTLSSDTQISQDAHIAARDTGHLRTQGRDHRAHRGITHQGRSQGLTLVPTDLRNRGQRVDRLHHRVVAVHKRLQRGPHTGLIQANAETDAITSINVFLSLRRLERQGNAVNCIINGVAGATDRQPINGKIGIASVGDDPGRKRIKRIHRSRFKVGGCRRGVGQARQVTRIGPIGGNSHTDVITGAGLVGAQNQTRTATTIGVTDHRGGNTTVSALGVDRIADTGKAAIGVGYINVNGRVASGNGHGAGTNGISRIGLPTQGYLAALRQVEHLHIVASHRRGAVSSDAEGFAVTGGRAALLVKIGAIELLKYALKGGQRAAETAESGKLLGCCALQACQLGTFGRAISLDQRRHNVADIESGANTCNSHDAYLATVY